MPLISIVIPAYNAEKFIIDCLNHITCQDFKDYEVIIVNDGSNDRTQQVCEEYIKQNKDVNIKLINQPNSGVSFARNVGISNARGEWVTFVDADDFLIDGALQWFSSIELKNKDIVLANYTRTNNVQAEEETNLTFIDSDLLLRCVLRYVKYYKKVRKNYSVDPYINWTCWGKFYKRELLLKYNISFPQGIYTSEDTVFLVKLYNSNPKVFASNKIIYHYSVNSSSVTQTFNSKIVENTIRLVKSVESVLSGDYAKDMNAFICERMINSYRYILKNDVGRDESTIINEITYKYKKADCFKYIFNSGYRKVFMGKRSCLMRCRLLFKIKKQEKKHGKG